MKNLILLLMLMAIPAMAEPVFVISGVNPDDVTGFIVYFSTEGSTEFHKNVGKETEIPLSMFHVKHNVEYTYRVSAYTEAGESLRSEPVFFTWKGFEPGPDILPEIVVTIPEGKTTIKIITE